ncbi:hypothetical protein BWQ96_05277 [Gracilariopsis chorda]|uniref:Uncharacterized protein n=1 Tax=Gracilariopsis chorda TaxID=448386 RepID=A0A2V3ITB5_9FLOR|nr:hypothetical protein BWQ96_05277 [Gracilariopsis chorda]|eukprot:PXF44977.1 hypothetical protein BWQ96_05277 [Gracilariopsis chorda]
MPICADHELSPYEGIEQGLRNLELNPDLYDSCRPHDSNITCNNFLQQPPLIAFKRMYMRNNSDEAFVLQKLLKCGPLSDQFLEFGSGRELASEIDELTASDDDWCMWYGHSDCWTFNQLVDYTQIMAEKNIAFQCPASC